MPRVALKVDCDTCEGTLKGLPNLLRLFDELKIRASFFFTLGPDNSGRAIRRVFTRKGFLKKMLRSNAAALYGPKTMLYGTLLPAPVIGRRAKAEIRSVGDEGHDVGVHGWDHVRWHDYLDRMSAGEIERDYGAARRSFEEIFGRKAMSSAAPGWHATPASLAFQETFGLLYASDTRGGSPCFLESFNTLEIPTTLPTWDEAIGTPECPDDERLIAHYRSLASGTEVHTVHTEVEGTARLGLFRRQLEAWLADGVSFLTMADLAREQKSNRSSIPRRRLQRTEIPNRGGLITATV